MKAINGNLLLILILITNEQVWSDSIPKFYNFSENCGWANHDGNWRFTYQNDHPEANYPKIDSDAGYTFSEGTNNGMTGLASPVIIGVDETTAFSFSYWFSLQTAFSGTVGIEFYGTNDNFATLLPIGNFISNNTWETGHIYCSEVTCCEKYPCSLQILVLNTEGDWEHLTISALQWFASEARSTSIIKSTSTITTISSTTTTNPSTITTSETTTTPSTITTHYTTATPIETTYSTTIIPSTITTTLSTTETPTETTLSTTETPTERTSEPSTRTTTTTPPTTTSTLETTTPFVNTVTYNFSSCTTGWFNYGDGNWKFTCMDDHPDILHPHIDSDAGYTFSQDGSSIPMVGLSSPIITGVDAETIFTFSYWFSLSTAFPGSVGLEFYSSIDNFGTLKPLGNFLASDEWTIGSIKCSFFKCCATYPCDLQIMVLNTKGDVDHPTVSALQWLTIGNTTSN